MKFNLTHMFQNVLKMQEICFKKKSMGRGKWTIPPSFALRPTRELHGMRGVFDEFERRVLQRLSRVRDSLYGEPRQRAQTARQHTPTMRNTHSSVRCGGGEWGQMVK